MQKACGQPPIRVTLEHVQFPRPMLNVLPPPPDLRPWVQGAVVLRSPAHLTGSCFPAQASSMLVIRLAGSVCVTGPSPTHGHQPLPAAALIAPSTRFTCYAHEGSVHAVGLVLQPATLHCLIQGSAAGWADRHMPLADVPGVRLSTLMDALHSATDDWARMQLLFQCMRCLLNHPRHDTRRQRLQHLGDAMANDLPSAALALGVSPRQLQRLCMSGFGLTPKQYQTLARLRATLASAWRQPASGLLTGADTAVAHGFFDQSHLARDMRRLVGTPMGTLLRQAGQPDSPHWPLDAGTRFS